MVEALASRGMGVPPMKHGQDARVTSGFPSAHSAEGGSWGHSPSNAGGTAQRSTFVSRASQ